MLQPLPKAPLTTLHYVQGQTHQANPTCRKLLPKLLPNFLGYICSTPIGACDRSHSKLTKPTVITLNSIALDHWSTAVQPEFVRSSPMTASAWMNQQVIRRGTTSSKLSFWNDRLSQRAAMKGNFCFDGSLSTSRLLLHHELASWSSHSRPSS